MENNKIISLAPRKSGERSKKNQLYSVGISFIILASDLVWFFIRRSRSYQVAWWEIVILVISGLFLLFSLLGLLFTSSNNKFNKKIANEPLIAYDTEKKVFIVQSFIEMKAQEFERGIVKSISISPESDEATLNYTKDGKEKTLIIGYATYESQNEINDLINKYKYQ